MKALVLLLVCVGVSLAQETYEKSCEGRPDPGMCAGYFPKYYYDKQTGTCKRFIYGGCQGNGNRYDSQAECLRNCAGSGGHTCSLKPEPGPCKAYMPSYYYDRETGTCKKFIYGGCDGNSNRFRTEKECLEYCSGKVRAEEDVCYLKSDKGPCLAYFPKYYYNYETGKCEKFIYGGCLGNGNRFSTKEECYGTCGHRADEEEDVCNLEPDGGLCRAYFPMYYFDSKTGECKEFIYGGCQGNGNRFATKEDCYKRCSAVWNAQEGCSEDPETGPCRGYFPRYYFNKDTGVCEEFIYGGCRGNKNNYKTYEDCANACGAP